MRADARANRQAVVEAARWVFAEDGTSVAMERVASRAGVGIATLYRRFPERRDLVKAVLVDILGNIETATHAAEEQSEGDPSQCWELLVRSLAEIRFGLLMPTLAADAVPLVQQDAELREIAERTYTAVERIFGLAQEAGHLRKDVTLIELHLLFSAVARPVPRMPQEIGTRLAERFVELVVNGLRARPDDIALPGPPLERDELLERITRDTAPTQR